MKTVPDYSFYAVSSTQIKADGGIWWFQYDFGESFLVHAVLMTTGVPYNDMDDELYHPLNYYVSVGENKNDYTENTNCTGAPFNDPTAGSSSWTTRETPNGQKPVWKFGGEHWCNL